MDTTFVRRERIAPLPPPLATRGMLGFARQRLFGSVLNTALTLLSLLLLIVVLPPLLRFLIIDAVWDGASRVDCRHASLGRENKKAASDAGGYEDSSNDETVRVRLHPRQDSTRDKDC